MFTALCIIFLTSASFLPVQTSTPCQFLLSVDITNGILLSNSSILYDDLVFPKESQFSFNNTIRGCVCDITPCIRKCCPEGMVYTDEGCKEYQNLPPLMYHNYMEPIVNSTPDLYRIYGGKCNGPTQTILLPEIDKFFIQHDGQLYMTGMESKIVPRHGFCYEYFNYEEIKGNYSVLLCMEEYSETLPKPPDVGLVIFGMIISMPFLLLTFIVYALLPERNIHGKCLMSYVITLFGAYVLLVSIQLHHKELGEVVCKLIGLTCLFFFMVSFFWMNVMSIDIWWTFSGMRGLSGSKKQSERRKFLIYNLYAWGAPLLLVILVASLSLSKSLPPHAWYNPGMGAGQCWFRDGLPTFVYFYLPMAIIILANMAFFIITAYKIKQVQRDTSMLRKDESKKHSLENDKQRFNLYLKLLLAMGVNWIMEIVSWAVDWQVGSVPKAVWYLTDFCNALYGVFIFFIFVFKRNIWKMLKRRYYTFMGKPHLARGMTQTGYSSRTRGSSLNHTVTSDCKSYADDTSITLTSQVA